MTVTGLQARCSFIRSRSRDPGSKTEVGPLGDTGGRRQKALEEGREPLKTLTVRAPSSGYVFQKPAFKGTRVAPGDKIFDVVDLSSVWVIADIYEYEIPFVKIGQKARITLSYFPEKEFISKVDFIYPSLSGQTRTAKARFVIPNPGLIP